MKLDAVSNVAFEKWRNENVHTLSIFDEMLTEAKQQTITIAELRELYKKFGKK